METNGDNYVSALQLKTKADSRLSHFGHQSGLHMLKCQTSWTWLKTFIIATDKMMITRYHRYYGGQLI